ncbi:MAG: TetR/AcrR family transcriptional regulator, partial [Pseudomonadota bacterium]
MAQFWAAGYSETSLSDLEAATGLNRRQLYNGIGDKRTMFLVALDDFVEASVQQLLAPLEGDDAGAQDVRILFDKFISMANEPDGWHGCLVCSSSQEEIAHDPAVRERHASFFDRIRNAHLNALTRAMQRTDSKLSIAELNDRADGLFSTHVSLCVLGRARRPVDQLKRIASHGLRCI